jgi:hypothetical protein
MTDDSSNTARSSKKVPGVPFAKGVDPRRWTKGRPKSFDMLRELAQEIAHEKIKTNGVTLVIEGHAVTVTEAILRQWAQSKNPLLQKQFIEVAFGKVPDKLDITSDGEAIKIKVKITHENDTV